MKIHSYLLIGLVCTILFVACRKNLQEKEELTTDGDPQLTIETLGGTEPCRQELEPNWYYDSLPSQTVLGPALNGNPYAVLTMRQASINLYGHHGNIAANKKYVRFRPMDPDQVELLNDADLDLFDYPLDRDVIEHGDYYLEPGFTMSDYPWLYTVVEMNFVPPAGITYEILSEIYVPDNDLLLEDEALRISGNTIDDSCTGVAYRPPVPCEIDPCAAGCPLSQDCNSQGGGGSGSTDPRKPAGQILVWDSNKFLDGQNPNVPVRLTRVVARRYMKVERMYTNNQGRFRSTKNFRNKVNIFVKFKNNNLRITGLIGTSITRALFPMKHGIGIYSGNLNNITYIFPRGSSTGERAYRYWWAAQYMNAYLEYNAMASTEQIGQVPANMKVVLTRLNFMGGSGATPMNAHRPYVGSYGTDYIQYYFARPLGAFGGEIFNGLSNGLLFRHIDMGLGYSTGTLWRSNDVKHLMYHEMTHASHFNKVGNSWFNDFVLAECFTLADNGFAGVNAPYGIGDDGEASEIISVGESWAEHVAQVFSNIQYGVLQTTTTNYQGQAQPYTYDFPVPQLGAHLNALEDFSPNRLDPFAWIPEGIYYDLIDNRNDRFFRGPLLPIDNVVGYTNMQLYQALDSDIKSMMQYRTRLLLENNNNQSTFVLELFGEYYY